MGSLTFSESTTITTYSEGPSISYSKV